MPHGTDRLGDLPALRTPSRPAFTGMPAPEQAALFTDDDVRISAAHVRPGPDTAVGLGFVVAHGFTGSWRRPAVLEVMARLRAFGGVVGFDFRGHGTSGGASTV